MQKPTPIQDWLCYRQQYVEELIRHDGRAGHFSCAGCGEDDGRFKCQDCFGSWLFCKSCLLDRHVQLPFHRIQVGVLSIRISSSLTVFQFWTGKFFQDSSLQKLGLRIQLGHDGEDCPCPGHVQTDFVVVDTTGVHYTNLQFCECFSQPGASHHRTQLLRSRLLPSSVNSPRSAFSFDVLDSFHLLTLQGKTSAYDYYLSIAHKTDNTGVHDVKVRSCYVRLCSKANKLSL
jgi:hypothetical protein